MNDHDLRKMDTAQRHRASIEKIVYGFLRRERPEPRRGLVIAIARADRTCDVVFRGSTDADAVTVAMYDHQPALVGDVVEVRGKPGSLYVSRAITANAWQTVAYASGFTASGRDLQWRIGHGGDKVEFMGAIQRASLAIIENGTTVAHVGPEAYPSDERIVGAGSDLQSNSMSLLYVDAAGALTWQGSPNDVVDDPTWISLDGAWYSL